MKQVLHSEQFFAIFVRFTSLGLISFCFTSFSHTFCSLFFSLRLVAYILFFLSISKVGTWCHFVAVFLASLSPVSQAKIIAVAFSRHGITKRCSFFLSLPVGVLEKDCPLVSRSCRQNPLQSITSSVSVRKLVKLNYQSSCATSPGYLLRKCFKQVQQLDS